MFALRSAQRAPADLLLHSLLFFYVPDTFFSFQLLLKNGSYTESCSNTITYESVLVIVHGMKLLCYSCRPWHAFHLSADTSSARFISVYSRTAHLSDEKILHIMGKDVSGISLSFPHRRKSCGCLHIKKLDIFDTIRHIWLWEQHPVRQLDPGYEMETGLSEDRGTTVWFHDVFASPSPSRSISCD